jgi:methylthioribose-1-phosphate isomerase
MLTQAIIFENDRLKIIDQTLLPRQCVYIPIESLDDCIDAIKQLKVRGAPAIGICAAYGLYVIAKSIEYKPSADFFRIMDQSCDLLFRSRPTAVNLGWAVDRIRSLYNINKKRPLQEVVSIIKNEAIHIHSEDNEACQKIGFYGLEIVSNPCNILTHCNTGSLATGGWGTALGIIYAAHQANYDIHVYVDETRPLGQGARLTLWELSENKIPCTLITDSMAGALMKDGKVDLVLFGADRIARNGDVANKIGSYGLAALARLHAITCYAAAPSSTFDLSLASGNEINIELRNSQEILHIYGYNDNLFDNTAVYNPAFDVTPSAYLTGIVTEKGIINQPTEQKIIKIMTP